MRKALGVLFLCGPFAGLVMAEALAGHGLAVLIALGLMVFLGGTTWLGCWLLWP